MSRSYRVKMDWGAVVRNVGRSVMEGVLGAETRMAQLERVRFRVRSTELFTPSGGPDAPAFLAEGRSMPAQIHGARLREDRMLPPPDAFRVSREQQQVLDVLGVFAPQSGCRFRLRELPSSTGAICVDMLFSREREKVLIPRKEVGYGRV